MNMNVNGVFDTIKRQTNEIVNNVCLLTNKAKEKSNKLKET